jgi:hypothetical protein
MDERMARLEAAVDKISTYVESLKSEFDGERFDAAVAELEGLVPSDETTPSEEIDETA